MRLALPLALIILLCTCGRAQKRLDKLPRDLVSIAFVKSRTGSLIDSMTVRTTLDTVPYGFAFPNRTLFLDVSIYDPSDELTLETFAKGRSLGHSRCWVDAPTADVHLSIRSGRSVIDSVGLSFIDGLYRQEMIKVSTLQGKPDSLKKALLTGMYNYYNLPFIADLLMAYSDLPNLGRKQVNTLALIERFGITRVRRHPRFDAVWEKGKLMKSLLPGKLHKYDLKDSEDQPVVLRVPKDEYYVLNFYNSTQPQSRQDHQIIANSLATDSIFVGANLISISGEGDTVSWQRYVREGGFGWPHYHEDVTTKRNLTTKMALYPTGTYVLINDDNLIEGVYDSVVKIAAALRWRRREMPKMSPSEREQKILDAYLKRFGAPEWK